MSIYPAQIDNSISLPVVVDDLTPVNSSDINNLRTTIIAIEMELGIKPSLQYSTVRARLDSLESSLLNKIEIGGDIGGTTLSPMVIGIMGNPVNPQTLNPLTPLTRDDILIWDGIYWSPYDLFLIFGGDLSLSGTPMLYGDTQTVVGLQNIPLLSSTPDFGNTIVYNGIEWEPLQVAQDYILPPFDIQFSLNSLLTNSLYEVNQIISNPAFLGVYLGNYPTETMTVHVSETYTPYNKDISLSPLSFIMDKNYVKNVFDGYITFTMTAVKAGITKVLDLNIYWGQKNYWGVDIINQSGASFIKALSDNILSLSRSLSFIVNAGSTQSIYYACRSAYGIPTFCVESIEGGFAYVGDYLLTNDYGFSEYYSLYESDNIGLGLTTVFVI